MAKYASMVSGTAQSEEAKLWVYQSSNHFEQALKGKSNRSTAVLKANERERKTMYKPSFVSNGIYNFVYYNSNDEPRVDKKAILRMNPNSGDSKKWQGASYFFEWKEDVSDWLMFNSGFMLRKDEVWLSSLTHSKSATKGFGKGFKAVKYSREYADQDRRLWQEAMQELKTQTDDRKAKEREQARKDKEEEGRIGEFLSLRDKEVLEEKKQAEEIQKARELRRTVNTLNREAAADLKMGGAGMGKRQKPTKTGQTTGTGESSKLRGDAHRREKKTIGTDQNYNNRSRGGSPKGDKNGRK